MIHQGNDNDSTRSPSPQKGYDYRLDKDGTRKSQFASYANGIRNIGITQTQFFGFFACLMFIF